MLLTNKIFLLKLYRVYVSFLSRRFFESSTHTNNKNSLITEIKGINNRVVSVTDIKDK